MSRIAGIARCGLLALLPLLPLSAYADGLADVKAALQRLQGQGTVKAVLDAKTWRRLGDGSDATERHGQASVLVDDGSAGLQVIYSKEILARIEQEERARAKDPNSKTPTISALREFEAGELREMTQAAQALSRSIEKATYKGERQDLYMGKSARLLSFDISVDSLSERERKYVKKFDGNLSIWITADGTPLASKITNVASGRAFIIISFEAKSEEQNTYALWGDRLLTMQKESKRSASGAGERSEEKVTKSIQVVAPS